MSSETWERATLIIGGREYAVRDFRTRGPVEVPAEIVGGRGPYSFTTSVFVPDVDWNAFRRAITGETAREAVRRDRVARSRFLGDHRRWLWAAKGLPTELPRIARFDL